ncbi:MAG: hypothetical protein RLY86_2612 [Pseudomonadota bacterium]|jgi:hypothetical protein
MTDHTFDHRYGRAAEDDRTDGRTILRRAGGSTGFGGGLMRDLYEDFRSVPVEAWIILAVATVMSNLFIALA